MAATTELDRVVTDRLERHELRYTSGRRAIVAALRAADGPITLPDLLDLAPTLPQSSAYRNLALMEEAGVVRRVVHRADYAHFELAEELTEHHHHMICESCGSVQDFTLPAKVERTLDAAFREIAEQAGATETSHLIDLFVVCGDCPADR
ncbi:Fur family transcriptional regulator [Ilumatobacter nonamiensis]|uniref:Fur family transcriptional regulator n=1 Tax=Ilumatobacter nonamiensis TaxID=467093 RepID=UPI0003495BA7|nr:Fur family transcriptional regulator [Ilumatobacter nonamiensis]